MKPVVVIPLFNEDESISPLIDRIEKVDQKYGLSLDILAVDDGSTDATSDRLRELTRRYSNVYIAVHRKNKGMAAALKSGIKTGLGKGYDAFVFMDGDGTHNPEEIPRLLDQLKKGSDFVVGSRFVSDGGMINVPAWRVLISKGGNFFGRIILRMPIRDATSGYRAMNRKVLEATRLEETGFPIQLEETIKVAAKGFIMSEIPIILNSRKNGQSKFHFSLKLLRNYASVLHRGLKWRKEHSRS